MLHMIDPDQALATVLNSVEPLAPRVTPAEESLGLILAEEIRADRPYPPFNRAMMDGYAIRLADAGRVVKVAGEIAAGACADAHIRDGSTYAIMTGAPCPPGTEAIIPVERASRTNGSVHLSTGVTPGEHVAPQGSECRAGQTVAHPGDRITPLVIANLATFGLTHVRVVPNPVCAVITTGSELAGAVAAPAAFQIRDANGPMLSALLREAGIPEVIRCHAADTLESLESALTRARSADVVLLTGGVSAGAYDLVPAALEAHGVHLMFHKVTQKPGKPLLFGKMGTRLFFGLPGNPLATHLGFHRYVLAALHVMAGRSLAPQPVLEGRLAGELQGAGTRTLFKLCRVQRGNAGWRVIPLPGKGSADIFSVALANAYVRIDPDVGPFHTGERVAFTPLGELP